MPSNFYDERTRRIVDSGDWNFAALTDYFHAVSNLPFSSCFLKREYFDYIKIDFTIVMMFDMSLFLQMLLSGKNIGFIKEVLVFYRIHEGQISSSSNVKKCQSMSFFEHIPFLGIFFETENVCALQRLLNRGDISSLEMLRMELAKYFLNLPVITFQIVAYRYLHDYFQSEVHRIDERYTISQFRKTYSPSKNAFRCLNNVVDVSEIGIKRLTVLLFRKCMRKILSKRKQSLSHL